MATITNYISGKQFTPVEEFTQYNSDQIAYDPTSADSYVNAENQSRAWLREDQIRKEGYAREDNSYHRLFNELKSLGVNPALLMSSVASETGSAGGNSAASFKTSNFATTGRSDQATSAKIAGALVAAIALIIAAA